MTRTGQLGDKLIDFLKACRTQPKTAAELMEITGWSKSTVHGWARLFVSQGMIVDLETNSPRNVRGSARKAFVVSHHWGGPKP